MTYNHPPIIDCANCGATFAWVLLEDTEIGDIYECENCNNLIMINREVMEHDN